MIHKLQRKFVLIATISVLLVVLLVFGVILALNISSLNGNMDMLVDRVSEGGGKFIGSFENSFRPDKAPPKNNEGFDFITPETPFATRHFTIFFDKSGKVIKTNTDSIYSISEPLAIEYAKNVYNKSDERGWYSNYRYKQFKTEFGTGIVFVDGSVSRSSLMQSTVISGIVLAACAALVLVLIFSLSKKAVKPIAESYEKQKQFITDANHELKTPLTLILTNLDIAESELGQNEWLDDIRTEGTRMTELVNKLVALSRMDEDSYAIISSSVSLGKMVSETVSEFEPLAKARNKLLSASVDESIVYNGDESLLRQLLGILMDNAIKYCDLGGDIVVTLTRHRRICLTVENSYSAVNEIELNRLFDRFYRADKSRTQKGSYGVGLSVAKLIAEKHKGELTAYSKNGNRIGFKVVL